MYIHFVSFLLLMEANEFYLKGGIIMELPILYIVIPCYNEQDVLPITCDIFLNKIKELIQ